MSDRMPAQPSRRQLARRDKPVLASRQRRDGKIAGRPFVDATHQCREPSTFGPHGRHFVDPVSRRRGLSTFVPHSRHFVDTVSRRRGLSTFVPHSRHFVDTATGGARALTKCWLGHAPSLTAAAASAPQRCSSDEGGTHPSQNGCVTRQTQATAS